MLARREVIWSIACFAVVMFAAPQAHAVTITGTVVDAEGKPVTDANVFTRYRSADEWAVARAKPDEQGKFVLEFDAARNALLPKWRVAAFSPAYALECEQVADNESCALRLTQKPVPCEGIVADQAGKGICGAGVSVTSISWGGEGDGPAHWVAAHGMPEFNLITDATGRFNVQAIPPAAHLWFRVTAPGRASIRKGFDTGKPGELRIVLLPAAEIRGRVTRDGNPVSGLRVFAQSQGRLPHGWDEAISGPDGSYMLGGLIAGLYNVMLDPPEGLTAVALEGLELKKGEHVTAPDLKLIKGGIVEGTATKQGTGEPFAGAWVVAHGPARPRSSAGLAVQATRTDDKGHYKMVLPPGVNTLIMEGLKGWQRVEPERAEVKVKEGDTIALDFAVLPDPKIDFSVTVVGPEGEPAEGVLVSTRFSFLGGRMTERVTDAEGRAQLMREAREIQIAIQHLDELPFVILARDPERDLAGTAIVRDVDEPIQIHLSEGAYAVGQVVDMEDKPLAGVRVRVGISSGGGDSTDCLLPVSDENGEFRIGPLPADCPLEVLPGMEADRIATDKAWWDLGHITLRPGQEYRLPLLRLNPEGARAEGRVLDAEGNPVAGAIVASGGYHPKKAKTTTDVRGEFRLKGLPARGDVSLLAFVPGKDLYAVAKVGPGLGYAPDITLAPLGKAKGRVVKPGGEPLANADIVVWSTTLDTFTFTKLGLPRKIMKMCRAKRTETDANGGWEAGDLVAGLQYEIVVMVATPQRRVVPKYLGRFTAEGGKSVDVPDVSLRR